MLTLGCSLVNAPPMEGNLDATGDTVHAVSKDHSSVIETTLFATAGSYVQAARLRALQPGHRWLRCPVAPGTSPAAAALPPTILPRPTVFAD
jgi:hypothetical protein